MLIARDFLGDDDFVMFLGDNLLEQDLASFVDAFEIARSGDRPPAAQILLKQVPDPHRFGIATLDDAGNVVQLVEKPDVRRPISRWSASISSRHGSTTRWQRSSRPPRGELEITDAIQWLLDAGERVRCELLTGWWIDTGKLTPLLEANRLLLERIEQRLDGEVDDVSTIDGRVIVAEGCG